MKRGNIILGIGIALLLIPVLGFPPAWKSFFTVVLGLWLCGLYVEERRARFFGARTALSEKLENKTVADANEQTPTA